MMCELMRAWFPLNVVKLWEQEPVVLRVVLARPRAYGDAIFLHVDSAWWFIMKTSAFIFTAVTNLNPLVFIVSWMLRALMVHRLFVEWSAAGLVCWGFHAWTFFFSPRVGAYSIMRTLTARHAAASVCKEITHWQVDKHTGSRDDN